MAILGARAAVDFVLPGGIDGGEIFKFEVFRTRKTAAEIVAEAAALIGNVNQQIADKYGDISYITESLYGFTRQGETSRSMTPLGVEYKDSDAVRSDIIGHMLPLSWYEDALGWTERYLKYANDAQIYADAQLVSERWLNRFDYQFITRLLTNTENLIGSAGYDVGWAIGTGTTVNYIPPQWREKVFDTTHTHFVVKNSSTGGVTKATLIESMVDELRHHGYDGRLLLLISEDDLAAVTALPKFVPIVPSELQPLGATSSVQYIMRGTPFEGVPGEMIGMYTSPKGLVEVRYHGRIPTNYMWMTKPMGALNARNGVAVRVDSGQSFGMYPDPILTRSVNPRLEKVRFVSEFGVGVNDRLNGVAGYINAGATTWVNPTIV